MKTISTKTSQKPKWSPQGLNNKQRMGEYKNLHKKKQPTKQLEQRKNIEERKV